MQLNLSKTVGWENRRVKRVDRQVNPTDSILFQEINLAVILEKLASDFYEEFGRGSFLLPKTLLSDQPMVNEFGPDEGRWFGDKMFSFIKRNQDKRALRIMSRFVNDYHDFKDALCLSLEGEPISFIQFLQLEHRPPTHLLIPEGAVCILMHHVSTGKKLYSDSPWTFTRCEEFYSEKNSWKLIVGGFSSGGLDVNSSRYDCEINGGAGVRKFLGH